MPTHNQDKLLELVNSFLEVFELENSEEIRKQLAEGTGKLHKEKAWDQIIATVNSSDEIADITDKQGHWGEKNHHRLETALTEVPVACELPIPITSQSSSFSSFL